MIDKPHIFFIDAHAERIRRDDHLGVTVHEALVYQVAFLRLQAAVIKNGVHAIFLKRS